MIDTNVHLFQWPFRRLPADDPDEFVLKLKARGVEQAWAGSFEALLNRDVSGERFSDFTINVIVRLSRFIIQKVRRKNNRKRGRCRNRIRNFDVRLILASRIVGGRRIFIFSEDHFLRVVELCADHE